MTIIADDLTGAADCGIAFRLAGLSTFVSIGHAAGAADVVALDTDTRHQPAAIAADRTFEATAAAYRDGSRGVYKKIDSTLRGNVGVEVAAAHRAAAVAGPALVVACPAFPATGRITRGGRVLVGGIPLDQTDLWRGSGMTGPADLVSMLARAGLEAGVAGLEDVRRGADSLRARLAELAGGGASAVVCDADQESDLQVIAEAGAAVDRSVVWCGSAGLARHLAALLAGGAGRSPAPEIPDRRGSILVVVGSRSAVAREQAAVVAAEAGVETIEVSPEALLAPGGDPWRAAAAALDRGVAAQRDVVLLSGLEHVLDLARGPELAAGLARLAVAELRGARGIVATGGDVARAVMGALGARGLHLVGEVEPGVPLGVADAPSPIAMVTKAGGFGDAGTLQRCRAALRTRRGG